MFKTLREWREKLSNILFEDRGVDGSQVADAIDNQYRVIINYDDETEHRKTGNRLIEPYVYGLSKSGNEVIRAFQYYGATRRGIPKYKMFRLDRILSWNPQKDSHFVTDPKKLAVTNIGYNENGDKGMSMVFDQVRFTDNNQQEPQNDNTRWQSPLDKIRKERENNQKNIEKQLNNKINTNQQGAIKTKSLEKDLNNHDASDFESTLDNALNSNQQQIERGAVSISQDKYDRDSKTPQERHDNEISRRRDKRWEYSSDNRPLYRKGSANDDLKNNDNENVTK